METDQNARANDPYLDLRAKKGVLEAARKALPKLEKKLWAVVADVQPDDPPGGERFRGADRGVQKRTAEALQVTGSHVRAKKNEVRKERVAAGKPERELDRETAEARFVKLSAQYNALHHDIEQALDAYHAEILRLLPFRGVSGRGTDDQSSTKAEVMKVTGYGQQQLDDLRARWAAGPPQRKHRRPLPGRMRSRTKS
ncbi:hypothetical protein ACFC1B_06715 [Streptomyces xiamenensis]|uniref:hypothetical protein n=1 Tax=Streptomyces xiamenensis TaxID=408015 RepID=UPI0035DB7E62